jgi:hypothetical protein
MELPTTVIYRKSKTRPRTLQTVRDEHALELRKRKAGEQYHVIEAWLQQIIGKKPTRQRLLTADTKLCELEIVHNPPDRLCKRKKDALICWFCENLAPRDNQRQIESVVSPVDVKVEAAECLKEGSDSGDVEETDESSSWNVDFEDNDWGNQRELEDFDDA